MEPSDDPTGTPGTSSAAVEGKSKMAPSPVNPGKTPGTSSLTKKWFKTNPSPDDSTEMSEISSGATTVKSKMAPSPVNPGKTPGTSSLTMTWSKTNPSPDDSTEMSEISSGATTVEAEADPLPNNNQPIDEDGENGFFDSPLGLWLKKYRYYVILASFFIVTLISYGIWKLSIAWHARVLFSKFCVEDTWDFNISQMTRNPDCGISNGIFKNKQSESAEFIRAGMMAEPWEFPWMARVTLIFPNGMHSSCGGSIIHEKYVLTAAHCCDIVDSSMMCVELGDYNITTDPDCIKGICGPKRTIRKVENVNIFKHYSKINNNHDICLVKLNRKIPFSDYVYPICLPMDPEMQYNNFVGKTLIFAGWGQMEKGPESMPQILQKAEFNMNVMERCNPKKNKRLAKEIVDSQLCAANYGPKAICPGDSGGPLMYKSDNGSRYYVVGVASNSKCTEWKGYSSSSFMRVGYYMPWIINVTSFTE